jgi:hypothetical protein
MVIFDPNEICFDGFGFGTAGFEGVGDPASEAVEGGREGRVSIEDGMSFVGIPSCCVGDSCRLGKSMP